jgi:murein DD-endopeptidase MepM/ murein hydrolase activator NlpD
VLDLGSGVYALYAHMKPGSATVGVGDRVSKGQEIGRAGNSGNTSESHLHFHLMDGPLPLTADNLPFEIDRFTFQGTVTPDELVTDPPPEERTGELPLIYSAVGFPAAG